MPTIEQNRTSWDGDYPWEEAGEEWSSDWGGSRAQWQWSLLPRIHRFVPTGTILEIAPGFGRWTQYLKDLCEQLVVVDLSGKCIEACQQRFAGESHIIYHTNDGRSLAMIPDASIDFAFSFDSLVHAGPEVLEAYLNQLTTKLTQHGVAFIHHSNLGAYRRYYTVTSRIPRGKGLLRRAGLLDNDGWRDIGMTAKLFEQFAQKAGLQCISQELINWSSKRLIDCISVVTPIGSRWGRENRVVENGEFMDEARHIAMIQGGYV